MTWSFDWPPPRPRSRLSEESLEAIAEERADPPPEPDPPDDRHWSTPPR